MVEHSRKPATSTDVANLAKVSRATVSYVLNDVPNARISDETRKRVLIAATKLGYVPHKSASSLRSGKSNLVLLPFFDWPYNQSSLSFLQDTALHLEKLGYSVMFQFFRINEKKNLAQELASYHPIGVIVESADQLEEKDVVLLKQNGVKAILANRGQSTELIPSINIDFTGVGEGVGKYFVERGHQRIAVIVPRDKRILYLGLQRLEGVKKVQQRYDVHVERVDLNFDTSEAANLASRWRQGGAPTAVFTYNDEYGFLLMSALKDAGFRIPQDIALIGCDDLPICDLMRPRLTSVNNSPSVPAYDIAMYFHQMIQGIPIETPPNFDLSFNLVIRESC